MHDDVPSNAVLVSAMPLLIQQRALLAVFTFTRLRYPDTTNMMVFTTDVNDNVIIQIKE